ncbi:MAG: hypothetical protein H7834_14020 [Magnetococcus sp. YQC-9]
MVTSKSQLLPKNTINIDHHRFLRSQVTITATSWRSPGASDTVTAPPCPRTLRAANFWAKVSFFIQAMAAQLLRGSVAFGWPFETGSAKLLAEENDDL